MRSALSLILGAFLIAIVGFMFFLRSQNAQAAPATNLVISEVQIGGAAAGTTSNDFVEIYNPTSSDISLEGMRLGKRTSGTSSASVVAFADDDVVPAHGYFLWCNTSLAGSMSCDASGGGTVANDNSLALINGSLAAGTVLDAISFGSPGSTFGEGTSLTAPAGGTSVERKANASSTAVTMGIGGMDEFMGNAEDTNNNAADFVGRATPQPQNTASAVEPIVGASPTPTPTLSPSVSPSVTPTMSPTPSATPIPSASPTPTVTPTSTPTMTPTSTPSVTPTTQPSPTITPIPSVSPTPSVVTPTPRVIAAGPIFTCRLHYKPWRLFTKTYFFPFIACERASI